MVKVGPTCGSIVLYGNLVHLQETQLLLITVFNGLIDYVPTNHIVN